MRALFLICCCISASMEFLMDNTTPGQSVSSISDERYTALQKLIVELSVKQGKLERLLSEFQEQNIQLRQELSISFNFTNELKTEITSLRHDVNSLAANTQARGQQLGSMYNEVTANKQKLSFLEKYQNSLQLNLTKTNTRLEDHFLSIQNLSAIFREELGNIGTTQRTLQRQLEQTEDHIKEYDTRVGFTAFGTSNSVKSNGMTLMFPDIKSTYGISNLTSFTSSGIFTCEKEGLYLISITVMSCSINDSKYSVYKNNARLAPYYIGGTLAVDTDCNSGSGSIVSQLNLNDTICIKTDNSDMHVYDMWSSLSVIKIR